MTDFIKIVASVDKITDCIPIVSTVKNVSILLYQLIHKVDKTANPVRTSWVDDLKIHALSKSDFMAGIAAIPIIGNITCLFYYVLDAMVKLQGGEILGAPKGYLKEATRQWHLGTEKHSYEIVALYLARNPDLSEKKLAKTLELAAIIGKEEVFKQILDSREWSGETLKKALKSTKSIDSAKQILDKCKDKFSNQDAGDVFRQHCFIYKETSYPIMELLIHKYPEMDIQSVSSALEYLVTSKNAFKPLALLLKNFPQLKEEDCAKALLKACNEKNKNYMELLEQHTPGIVEKNLNGVLKIAASRHDVVMLNWLRSQYKEQITDAQIGKVLAEQASSMYFKEDCDELIIIKDILSSYPNLPAECLVPVLKKAATHNEKLFKFYFNNFAQLKAEHLQDILNEAVYVYGKAGDLSIYAKRWKEVAALIQEKFPEMQAVDPYKKSK